jgi:hypothetical protein
MIVCSRCGRKLHRLRKFPQANGERQQRPAAGTPHKHGKSERWKIDGGLGRHRLSRLRAGRRQAGGSDGDDFGETALDP